jgi:hypothetical protein
MPDRLLQNHYCVAALQHRLSYNGTMSLSAREQSAGRVASARSAAGPRRGRIRSCRAGLAVVLLGIGMLTAACGLIPVQRVAIGFPSRGLVGSRPLAFVNCMRTHGEPNMPDPVVQGNSVQIRIKVGSGVDPGSARFNSAFKACKHLTVPAKGSPPAGLPHSGRSPS